MTTAFVLSGGASLGSIQVGMAQALYDEGIRPDLINGTSVGAVNGTWLAGERTIGGLVDLWHSPLASSSNGRYAGIHATNDRETP